MRSLYKILSSPLVITYHSTTLADLWFTVTWCTGSIPSVVISQAKFWTASLLGNKGFIFCDLLSTEQWNMTLPRPCIRHVLMNDQCCVPAWSHLRLVSLRATSASSTCQSFCSRNVAQRNTARNKRVIYSIDFESIFGPGIFRNTLQFPNLLRPHLIQFYDPGVLTEFKKGASSSPTFFGRHIMITLNGSWALYLGDTLSDELNQEGSTCPALHSINDSQHLMWLPWTLPMMNQSTEPWVCHEHNQA